MTISEVHQCPHCELRFKFTSELEDHLLREHPGQTDVVAGHDPYRRIQPPPEA